MCDLSMTVFTDWKFEGAYIRTRIGEKPFKCDFCELVFRRCIILCAIILGRPFKCDCMVRLRFSCSSSMNRHVGPYAHPYLREAL